MKRLDGWLKYIDISAIVADDVHGFAQKDMVVLHETVSPDIKGVGDLLGNAKYLDHEGYGVQGLTDAEGNVAWARSYEDAILYHAASTGSKGSGHINTRAIGIEQVSRVMLDVKDNPSRFARWWKRNKELEATASLLAYISHKHGVPLRYSDGTKPGVTAHWQVSQTFDVPDKHTDCWPKHLGGYYPMLRVIFRARQIRKKRYGH